MNRTSGLWSGRNGECDACRAVRATELSPIGEVLLAQQRRFRVAQELVRRLRQGEPQAGSVAASICLTDAVLARQLRAERTSIDELLDRVRRELAHEYLAGSDAPLAGIPALLGLQADAEFTSACRRWFVETPSDYRRHHGPDLPGS